MSQHIYNELAEMVKALVGNEILHLPMSVTIRENFFAYPLHLCAVSVSPDDTLYVMNHELLWYQVEPNDKIVIEKAHAAVSAISKSYLGAVVTTGEVELIGQPVNAY